MEKYLGKRALITGGAIRVGKALSLRLASMGCDIVLHYGSSHTQAEATAESIRALGVNCVLQQANLSNPVACEELVASAGPLDLLINSAARFTDGGLLETSNELWETEMAVNLTAPFILSRAFVSQLNGRTGNIINIVDARSKQAGSDHFAYRLTKVALEAMTANLAVELAPAVRVNAVALGAILPPPGKDQDHLDRIAEDRVPLKRGGSPEHVTAAVAQLLENSFLTGVVLPIDGGEFL